MNKIKLFTLFLSCYICYATSPAFSAEPTQFPYQAEIKGEFTPNQPVGVRIPEEVIVKTTNHFSNLRLFDDQHRETPYVIYDQHEPAQSPVRFTFQIESYHESPNQAEIILKRPEDVSGYEMIEFFTGAYDFKKSIQMDSGHKIGEWQTVTRDVIFDFSSKVDLRKTTVTFPYQNAPYLRIVLSDESVPNVSDSQMELKYEGLSFTVQGKGKTAFRIDRIEGQFGSKRPETDLFDQKELLTPTTMSDEEGNTLLLLGHINLPITQIVLEVSNPYFHRHVEVQSAESDRKEAYRRVSSGLIYKVPGMQTSKTDLSTLLGQQKFIRLKIINQDNPPLNISRITLFWIRKTLYFIPEATRRYTLYFGGENVVAPAYDLPKLIPNDQTKLIKYPELTLDPIKSSPIFKPSHKRTLQPKLEKILFIGVILTLSIVLGFWIFKLMKQIPTQKSE